MTFAHVVASKRAIFSDLKSSKVNALELVAALSTVALHGLTLGRMEHYQSVTKPRLLCRV